MLNYQRVTPNTWTLSAVQVAYFQHNLSENSAPNGRQMLDGGRPQCDAFQGNLYNDAKNLSQSWWIRDSEKNKFVVNRSE